MIIEVNLDPSVDDLQVAMTMVDQLVELAERADPVKAQTLRKTIAYRLKRTKSVDCSATNVSALPLRVISGDRGHIRP